MNVIVTSPELQELFASVGLERPQAVRKPLMLLSPDYQLTRWRLANLRLRYQVESAADLAEHICALTNAHVDSAVTEPVWRDLAEWEELEHCVLSLRQRLQAH